MWTGSLETMLMNLHRGYPSLLHGPSLSPGKGVGFELVFHKSRERGKQKVRSDLPSYFSLFYYSFRQIRSVIPCCFFGLSGSRYQFPKGFPDGKYKAYQDYIVSIIDTCDYELQTEILRIPSTKNVALVGSERKKRKRGESGSLTTTTTPSTTTTTTLLLKLNHQQTLFKRK